MIPTGLKIERCRRRLVDRYITNYLPNSNSGNYGNFSVVFPDIPFNLAVGSDLYPDIGFEAISATTPP